MRGNGSGQPALERKKGHKLTGAGKVYLIGGGPGDPELITLKAARILSESDVVLYDRLINDKILKHCRSDAQKIFVGKTSGNHPVDQNEIHSLLVNYAREYRIISRLKGGDPMIFGRGGEEREFLRARGIECEIVPGVTAACAAAASFSLPLTHREFSSRIILMTGHRREDGASDFAGLSLKGCTAVVYMGVAELESIAANLIEAGNRRDMPAAVIENASLPNQRMITAPLEKIAASAQREKIISPALVIIGETAGLI